MTKKPWHERPTFLALLELSEFRTKLRQNNLHDTSQLLGKEKLTQPKPAADERHLVARTDDGSYNDLEHPEMGMAGTRFARNSPLKDGFPDEKNIFTPNPRVISRKLMTREEFKPATILNVLAAAWIQFQNHDWFSHGSEKPNDKKFDVPLESDDPWPQEHRPLLIKKTPDDKSRPEGDKSAPPTHINEVTHWWDGSQIYGSTPERVDQVRSHADGKLKMEDNGLLPLEMPGIDLTGVNDNWWVGLSLLHNLFAREHNYLCDELKQQYPDWTDDQLFDKARLINAALTAKIHTVEWTPGILPHPALQIAMPANWWGLFGKHFKNLFGRVGSERGLSEALSGIVGSKKDDGVAPYYLTEEFAAVYRLHPLIPDEWKFYSLANGQYITDKNFQEVSGNRTRQLMLDIDINDIYYSMGIANPGAITLHNYPRFLQNLVRDNGETFDLAMVDIIRDRERGIPRYNKFREIIGMGRVKSFEEICPKNPVWAKELREVYNNDLEAVDLMVGMYAEDLPQGFGFSDTAFRVFILMASRRLKSDRFFTTDYRKEVYTQWGLDLIDKTTMTDIVLRHYPRLKLALFGVPHAFAPWRKVGISGYS